MDSNIELLGLYLHLAKAAERRQQLHVRDKLLILAGIIAVRLKLLTVAAGCRHKVLSHNKQHLIRRWQDLSSALPDDEFDALLKQLQRRFPLEKAEQMLVTLGIEMGREWETYYSAEEYAASLLDTTAEQLQEIYQQEQTGPANG